MSPDSLEVQTLSDPFLGVIITVSLGVLMLILACILIAAAVAAFLGTEQKRAKRKPKQLLVALAYLAFAAGCSIGGVICIMEWDRQQPAADSNSDAVQDWATSSYGVAVDDREAKSMAREILGSKATPADQTYTVQGADGILEVKLTETEDGTFHLVQTAAELKLPEPKPADR